MPALDIASMRSKRSEPHELVHTSDGITLFVRHWPAAEKTDTSILIFHGITAYSGVYGPLIAETLSKAGFNVYGLDLRGHGLSDGVRGDYPSENRLTEDLTETVKQLKSRSRKLVVLGHSLGVLCAVNAYKHIPDSIDALALLSAGRVVRPGAYSKPSGKTVLKALLAVTLLPGRPMIEYSRSGMMGTGDPLFNFRYSARFYRALYGVGALAVSKMMRSGRIDSPSLDLPGGIGVPLFIGVGDQDELFSVDSAKLLFDEIKSEIKEFCVMPGARHPYFPQESWNRLMEWLRSEGT